MRPAGRLPQQPQYILPQPPCTSDLTNNITLPSHQRPPAQQQSTPRKPEQFAHTTTTKSARHPAMTASWATPPAATHRCASNDHPQAGGQLGDSPSSPHPTTPQPATPSRHNTIALPNQARRSHPIPALTNTQPYQTLTLSTTTAIRTSTQWTHQPTAARPTAIHGTDTRVNPDSNT